MYEAFHDIRPVAEPAPEAELLAYDVVGPICETGDTFARERALPPLKAGDLVAFMTAGAYGAAMSSEYNSRLLVPEMLVNGSRHAIVRPRPTYDDMLARNGRRTGFKTAYLSSSRVIATSALADRRTLPSSMSAIRPPSM